MEIFWKYVKHNFLKVINPDWKDWCSPDMKNWLIGKDPDAGKDWRQEGKRGTEDEMVEWQHWLDGHEFEQAPGDSDEQGSLACCSPWGSKELDTTDRMENKDDLILTLVTSVKTLSPYKLTS